MIHTYNVDDVLLAVKVLLDADATLKDSDHLNGTQKVFMERVPNDRTKDWPWLVITAMPQGLTGRNGFMGELRVTNRCQMLDNGVISPLANKLSKQVVDVLSEASPSITGGTVQPLFCLGFIPAFADLAHPRESIGVARFRVEAGMDG